MYSAEYLWKRQTDVAIKMQLPQRLGLPVQEYNASLPDLSLLSGSTTNKASGIQS